MRRPTGNAVAERVLRTMKLEGNWARNWESADELLQAFESWMTTCRPRDRLCHGIRALLSWLGTPDEAKRLLEAAEIEGSPLYERIALAFGCGMRRAETSRARWEDVDFEKRTVKVHRAQVGRSHTIPMSPFVYDALFEFKKDAGPVATTSPSNAPRDLQRLCASIEIKCRSLHALRHGFASLLLARKVPTHVVARLGGWSDLKTLSRYSHPYDGAADEAGAHLGWPSTPRAGLLDGGDPARFVPGGGLVGGKYVGGGPYKTVAAIRRESRRLGGGRSNGRSLTLISKDTDPNPPTAPVTSAEPPAVLRIPATVGTPPPTSPPKPPPTGGLAPTLPWHLVCDKVRPYLFKIETPIGHGTGFLFGFNQNHRLAVIATAYHVVADVIAWRQPIKLHHETSGKMLYFEHGKTAVLGDERRDSAVIILTPPKEFTLPTNTPELLDASKFMKVGSPLGWMGYPSIAPSELCFFQGSVSARLAQANAYLLDGVAIHGVSGGPVFSNSMRLAGIVSAYWSNNQPGGNFPGLLKVVDVAHLHEITNLIKDLDAAIKMAEEQAQKPPPAPTASATPAPECPPGCTPAAGPGTTPPA